MSGDISTAGGYPGQAALDSSTGDFNALDFLVRQVVAQKAFSGMVEVVAVHGGGIGSPPTVDVQPLVNQQDGLGNQVPHGIVYGLPCFRQQSGSFAIITDPVKGDKGHAIICDRDISNVKASGGKQSAPGSFRQNSWADGCYYGGQLNGTPTNYIYADGSGNVIIQARNMTIDAAGNLTVMGEVKAFDGADFVTLSQHIHPSNGAPPTPGH